ncbi:MAG TPA: tRNA 2-thiouridine(34) synthase MnmA [Pirellulaceae bacterium]|nr:tRNA 2-thiouridine(34) synthase MnmA [Pirellulaceae bacterium]
MSRVVLAMSGGVDSSVAAHLLLEAGHEVIGVFMRHGEESTRACAVPTDNTRPNGASSPSLSVALPIAKPLGHKQGCCSASDAEDGRRVADRLGIPFYALNLRAEFKQIVDYFVQEYAGGRTPNPCVMCNNWIKFGKLFDYADSVKADFVATGHYARLQRRPDGMALLRGVDAGKDQSYVLFGIQRPLLQRMLLPVGHFQKPEIRRMAGQLGLNVADKKDSQEICFVTSGHHGQFVRDWLQRESVVGEIVTTDGRVVGEHAGVESFTIGQRKKLGVAMGEPYFVVRIDAAKQQVVIGRREELARKDLTASGANWLVDVQPGETRSCLAQIRYNSSAAEAEVTIDAADPSSFLVRFRDPQFGVAPGQAAVIFDADRVLGGGWIDSC